MEKNGDILDTLGERIEALLKKRLSATARAQIEIQQLFLVYLKEDHAKVATMWAVFRPMAWAMAIAAATIITLLVSGKVSIIVR